MQILTLYSCQVCTFLVIILLLSTYSSVLCYCYNKRKRNITVFLQHPAEKIKFITNRLRLGGTIGKNNRDENNADSKFVLLLDVHFSRYQFARLSTYSHQYCEYNKRRKRIYNAQYYCLRNGFNHINAQFNTALSVIQSGFRDSTNAVITISQKFYSQAKMFSSQPIKSGKKFVEKSDQFLCGTLSG